MSMSEEIYHYCKSIDFMKIGQAVEHGNWQAAINALQRLQKRASEIGYDVFDRNYTNLRQCLLHREQRAAKDALAVIIAKRVRILNNDYNSQNLQHLSDGLLS